MEKSESWRTEFEKEMRRKRMGLEFGRVLMDYLTAHELAMESRMLRCRRSMLIGKICLLLAGIILIAGLLDGCGEPELTEDIYKTDAYSERNLDKWATDIFNTVCESSDKPSDSEKNVKIPLSGKTILAYYDRIDNPSCNVYCKYNITSYETAGEDPIPDAPFFMPVVSNGDPVIPDVPESAWADFKEQCEYLIIYGGFESGRIADYYEGNIDRESVATVVYVIDPRKEKILLIKTIGTDSPGAVTYNPTGQVMHDEAVNFIVHLFEGL